MDNIPRSFNAGKNLETGLAKKVIGITGPDLIVDHGGAINHTINVIKHLITEFDFVLLPVPSNLKKYTKMRENGVERIKFLRAIGIKIPGILDKAVFNEIKRPELLKKLVELRLDAVFNFDYRFPLENEDFTKFIAKRRRVHYGVCLQGLGDYRLSLIRYFINTVKLMITSKSFKVVVFRLYQYLSRKTIVARINHDKYIDIILAINANFEDNVQLKRYTHKLFPSNGMENPSGSVVKILGDDINYSKMDQIIFVARHSYAKGIFDLKPILDIVFKNTTSKLVLIGRFEHKSEEIRFKNIMDKYFKSGKIIYKGFVNDKILYDEITRSKLMIYPSHSDAFSITVLQSLSLKTPVVAYDIAGLRIYRGLKPVRLVTEFDYPAMASEILQLLQTDNLSSLFGKAEEEFIEKHTWHGVAMQYREFLGIL